MSNDLENPMVVGDYYQQLRVYCSCDHCGRPIYEGDIFHLIGKDRYHCEKVCEECHQKKEAVIDD